MSTEIAKKAPPVINEVNAVLSMIERVACDPGSDVDKLERMLDMQERILNRQAEREFFAALNRCQTQMGRVAADASNPQTRSKYASYAGIDRALRPIYTREGISISYDTEKAQRDDYIVVVAYVSHLSGFTKRYSVEMPADGKGAKGGDVMTKTHATGAAMSYGMRYLLKMVFNVAVGEDDTDGNLPGMDEHTAGLVESIGKSKSMDELKDAYGKAFKAAKTNAARQQISRAKDIKKKELANG